MSVDESAVCAELSYGSVRAYRIMAMSTNDEIEQHVPLSLPPPAATGTLCAKCER